MGPVGTVSALVSRPGHIDLFTTGGDGAVWTTWWEAGPGWQRWQLVHREQEMAPGAPVSALVSRPGHIDLFATGGDGAVWTSWWEAGPGWQPWHVLA